MDTISVLNRTTKDGYTHTPYEIFTGEQIDYDRDFRCRRGELVILKNPKGISSDLTISGRRKGGAFERGLKGGSKRILHGEL